MANYIVICKTLNQKFLYKDKSAKATECPIDKCSNFECIEEK